MEKTINSHFGGLLTPYAPPLLSLRYVEPMADVNTLLTTEPKALAIALQENARCLPYSLQRPKLVRKLRTILHQACRIGPAYTKTCAPSSTAVAKA